jgi:hypothetical protein
LRNKCTLGKNSELALYAVKWPQRLRHAKDYRDGALPRLLRAKLQRTVLAGRGPHPAPRLALSFQKTAEIFRGRKKIPFTIKIYILII